MNAPRTGLELCADPRKEMRPALSRAYRARAQSVPSTAGLICEIFSAHPLMIHGFARTARHARAVQKPAAPAGDRTSDGA